MEGELESLGGTPELCRCDAGGQLHPGLTNSYANGWLCPSHPESFALERDSMLELVRNYHVDGIHFDYIRYPDGDRCYCNGYGTRFQAQTGCTVVNWPGAVLSAGALRTSFLDWRRAQITRLVEAVYKATEFEDVTAAAGLRLQTLRVAPSPGTGLYRLRTWLQQR